MSSRVVDSDSRHEFQRSAKSDGSGNMWRTRLKLVGQLVVDRFLERDGTDHVSAPLIRRHLFQQTFAAIKNSDTRRSEHLMTRKRIEIAIQLPHVHAHV